MSEKAKVEGKWLAIGVALGLAIGSVISNIPLGVCIGLGIGGAITLFEKKKNKDKNEK